MIKSIYIAGPLFTDAEKAFNKKLANMLRQMGITVYLPQEHEQDTPEKCFEVNVNALERSDTYLGIMDGPDPDSGTCWEAGYAYARKKTVLQLRTDSRRCEIYGFGDYNCQVAQSSTRKFSRVSSLIEYISKQRTARILEGGM